MPTIPSIRFRHRRGRFPFRNVRLLLRLPPPRSQSTGRSFPAVLLRPFVLPHQFHRRRRSPPTDQLLRLPPPQIAIGGPQLVMCLPPPRRPGLPRLIGRFSIPPHLCSSSTGDFSWSSAPAIASLSIAVAVGWFLRSSPHSRQSVRRPTGFSPSIRCGDMTFCLAALTASLLLQARMGSGDSTWWWHTWRFGRFPSGWSLEFWCAGGWRTAGSLLRALSFCLGCFFYSYDLRFIVGRKNCISAGEFNSCLHLPSLPGVRFINGIWFLRPSPSTTTHSIPHDAPNLLFIAVWCVLPRPATKRWLELLDSDTGDDGCQKTDGNCSQSVQNEYMIRDNEEDHHDE
ncbi:hypothetical protein U9M48_031474 [Paspalum notatum var. saurae]|uniref:Uncharacterized protein n=1 Tax=Paspalum notatum var. saurae TaxID=547442 RepID=A0AAQ3U5W6_PASNO